MSLTFREWVENNYNDLNNLYHAIMNENKHIIQKEKLLDHLCKEEFFIFIYKNTRHRF